MRLSDLIGPATPAGAALFLTWQGYHVFSVPKRELNDAPPQGPRVRLFGIGGKRINSAESFVDCALREGREEIGAVIADINSARQTYLLNANGTLTPLHLTDQAVKPRLIWEKQRHSSHGSMAHSTQSYYLVAFNAQLSGQPRPRNEIAALVYLSDDHLALIKRHRHITLADLYLAGAKVDCQTDSPLPLTTEFIPHGTVYFLLQYLNDTPKS